MAVTEERWGELAEILRAMLDEYGEDDSYVTEEQASEAEDILTLYNLGNRSDALLSRINQILI